EVIKSALAGRKLAFPFKTPIIFIPFLLLIVFATIVIYWVQKNIFFDLSVGQKGIKELDKAKKLNFLCSTDSLKMKQIIEKTYKDYLNDFVTIDFLTEKLDWDFDPDMGKQYYHLKNYHCLEKPEAVVEVIHHLKNKDATVIITSRSEERRVG